MENKVTLTMKEQHKLKMVVDNEAGKIRAQRAAELLGISKRQFRQLVAAYRQREIAAVAHGNRGRSPANRISDAVRQEILRLAKETYRDYSEFQDTRDVFRVRLHQMGQKYATQPSLIDCWKKRGWV